MMTQRLPTYRPLTRWFARFTRTGSCLACCGLATIALAQNPRDSFPADDDANRPRFTIPGNAPPRPPAPNVGRDPTQPSAEIREALQARAAKAEVGPNRPQALPEVRVKAKIISSRGAMAVLDVSGRLITVKAHDELHVAAAEGGSTRLRIAEISSDAIRLELGQQNQLITVP